MHALLPTVQNSQDSPGYRASVPCPAQELHNLPWTVPDFRPVVQSPELRVERRLLLLSVVSSWSYKSAAADSRVSCNSCTSNVGKASISHTI